MMFSIGFISGIAALFAFAHLVSRFERWKYHRAKRKRDMKLAKSRWEYWGV